MNVDGYANTRGPGMAKLLYAGPAKDSSTTKAPGSSPSSAATSLQSGVVVQISGAARAAFNELQSGTDSPAPTLKSKVDKLFQDARDHGTFITFDSSKGGAWMDMSSFTDDELSKITLDRSGEFSQELSDYAGGTLGARLKVSLEPYESAVGVGDRRGHVITIQKLYEQMSPDTRAALRWTPMMMGAAQTMLDGDNKIGGPFSMDTVLSNLISAAGKGGLSYNGSQD